MACAGAQIQEAMQHHTVCGVRYTMCQSMQQSFGVDWRPSEMHRTQCARSYSDNMPSQPQTIFSLDYLHHAPHSFSFTPSTLLAIALRTLTGWIILLNSGTGAIIHGQQ